MAITVWFWLADRLKIIPNGPYQSQPGYNLKSWIQLGLYPLVKIQKTIENAHRNSGFSH